MKLNINQLNRAELYISFTLHFFYSAVLHSSGLKMNYIEENEHLVPVNFIDWNDAS